METRKPVLANTVAEQQAMGIQIFPGTDSSISSLNVPIIGSDRVIGAILVEDYEREYAYNESDVRLIQTVAGSMGVALENARLVDETQRRAREMAALAEVGRRYLLHAGFVRRDGPHRRPRPRAAGRRRQCDLCSR